MKASKGLLMVCLAIGALVPATAQAAPDRTQAVDVGTTVQWTGDARPGTNVLYWDQTGTGTGAGACSKDLESFCDVVLVEYRNPVPDDDSDGRLTRNSTVKIDWPLLASDYDLNVIRSNVDGDRLAQVGQSSKSVLDGDDASPEQVAFSVLTTRAQPSSYFLIEVVYYAATGGYTGSIAF